MTLKDTIEADLNVFFDTKDFAQSATYTPAGGQAKTINCIFDDAFAAVQGVESSDPQVLVKDSDVIDVKHGDTLAVAGTTYKVRGIHPDGTGITTLILSKD